MTDREEFEKFVVMGNKTAHSIDLLLRRDVTRFDGFYTSHHVNSQWTAYKAACKYKDEEIAKLRLSQPSHRSTTI